MTKKVLPIKPKDIAGAKAKSFPPEVIETFNELIAKNYSGGSARILQKDVVSALVKKGFKSAEIFDNHWLDVEDIFRKSGWEVSYDRPGYCESYDASFEFTAK